MTTPPQMMTTRQVAEWLNVSVQSVLRWHKDGSLPGYQLNGDGPVRFYQEEIEQWLQAKGDRAVSVAR